MKFIIGKKVGMTQMFDQEGNVIPVTLVEASPCVVTQVKKKEKDGYSAVQVGCGAGKRKVSKPLAGHLARSGKEAGSIEILKEFRTEGEFKEGDTIGIDTFQEGDMIKASALSKGKGFAGAVKRWGFSGLPTSHGTKHEQRKVGSIGSRYPQRVVKGKKMPGRMGAERVSVRNLTVARVDPEKNLLAVRGALPGRKGAFVEIVKEEI